MKIFLSMPMNGKTEEEVLSEREEYIEIIKTRRPTWAEGSLTFIDNVRKPKEIQGDRVKMLGDSIMLMADADLVVMCPGWAKSNGCRIEKAICSDYNIPVYYLTGGNSQEEWYII